MVLSAFLLAPQTPVTVSDARLPTLARREEEWRKITDTEPTALIADLKLDLLLPKVPESYRGRWRYEALAMNAKRELTWVEGVAVMAVPDPAKRAETVRRRAVADWLNNLAPQDIERLRKNEMRIADLPDDARRALADRASGLGGDVLAAKIQMQPGYAIWFRSKGGDDYATSVPIVPRQRDTFTIGPITPTPPYVPPVVPLPPPPVGARLRFPEGKALTVRDLLVASYRAFRRPVTVDERVADRTLFVRGEFTWETLSRALVPITRVEPPRWLEPGSDTAERAPDLVGGPLSALWKDASLPPGVTRDQLRRGIELDAGQMGGLFPVLKGLLNRTEAEGPVGVKGTVYFSVHVVGSGIFNFGLP